MKKIFALIIAMLFVCVFNGSVYAESDSDIPQDVLTVANDGVESVKAKMAGDPKRWGFTDVDEIKQLTLGEGLRVNYIDGNKLSKASDKSIIALIDADKIETWEFTLDLDGNPKIFLTVAFEDGAYRVVRFGGNAEMFGAAKNNFKSLTNDKGATVKPTLLSVGPTYYLAATIDNNEFVLPVISDSSTDKRVTNELKPASEIIENLKNIQQNSVESGRGGSISGITPVTMSADNHTSLIITLVVGAALIATVVLLVRRHSCSH